MYDIQNPISYIPIGNQRDFGHTVQFDLTAWTGLNANDWKITYTRPGEAATYPVPDGDVSVANNVLTWTISEAVTSIGGSGSVIIEAYRGDEMLRHSARMITIIGEGHEPAGEAPDPVADWIREADAKLDEVDHFVGDTIEAAEAANAAALRAEKGEDAREQAEGLRVIAEQGRQDAYVIAEEARDGLYEAAEIARGELFESAETTRNTQSGEAADRANAIAGTLEGIAPLWSNVDISVSALGEGADPTASITQDETGTSISLGIPKGDTGAKGDKGNDGKPFNYRGDYSPDADPLYTKNDVVRFGGGSFVYINDVDSNEPTSSESHWQQIASMGGQDLVDAAVAARDAAEGYKDAAAASAAQLAAGTASPAGTYANLAELNDGTPTAPNTANIYITLDDGNWCYHNGSAWVAGGVYLADLAVVTSQLADIMSDVQRIDNALAPLSLNIDSWKSVQQAVKAGLAPKVFPIGTQLLVSHSVYGDRLYDVVAHDYLKSVHDLNAHTMTLLQHDLLQKLQFDAPEAFYYAETELPAGTYNFTLATAFGQWAAGTYQFTLANELPVGGQLTINGYADAAMTTRKVYAFSSRTNTTTTEECVITSGSEGTSLGTFGTELNHHQRVSYGSNNYKESAARQFLNSSAAAGSVWTPQTKFDRPPSWVTSLAGFVGGLDADFLSIIGDVVLPCATNSIYEAPDSTTPVNTKYNLHDKFYLASRNEVFGSQDGVADDSVLFPYYTDATNADRIKYLNDSAANWWARTPYADYAGNVRLVNSNGIVHNSGAGGSGALAPACTIV